MNSGTTSGPELLVELDRGVPEPLHRQLTNGLRDAIRTGRLVPETRLPSTRVLAADLGVSRRLVVDAYSQLAAEGFLLSRPGPGRAWRRSMPPARRATSASLRSSSTSTSRQAHRISTAIRGMRGCRRCGKASPTSSRCVRLRRAAGVVSARVAVADYLRRNCGVLADPQHSCCARGRHRPSRCCFRAQRPDAGDGGFPASGLDLYGAATQWYRAASGSCR